MFIEKLAANNQPSVVGKNTSGGGINKLHTNMAQIYKIFISRRCSVSGGGLEWRQVCR